MCRRGRKLRPIRRSSNKTTREKTCPMGQDFREPFVGTVVSELAGRTKAINSMEVVIDKNEARRASRCCCQSRETATSTRCRVQRLLPESGVGGYCRGCGVSSSGFKRRDDGCSCRLRGHRAEEFPGHTMGHFRKTSLCLATSYKKHSFAGSRSEHRFLRRQGGALTRNSLLCSHMAWAFTDISSEVPQAEDEIRRKVSVPGEARRGKTKHRRQQDLREGQVEGAPLAAEKESKIGVAEYPARLVGSSSIGGSRFGHASVVQRSQKPQHTPSVSAVGCSVFTRPSDYGQDSTNRPVVDCSLIEDDVQSSLPQVAELDSDGYVDCSAIDLEQHDAARNTWCQPMAQQPKKKSWRSHVGAFVDEGPDFNLPLHAKRVSPINFSVVDQWASSHRLERRWSLLKRFLCDREMYRSALLSSQQSRVPIEADLSLDDLEALLAGGIVEELTDGSVPYAYCRVFSINELLKQRRRSIQHTKFINAVFANVPSIEFPSLSQLMRSVHHASHHVTFDLKAWYFQIPLQRNVSCFHGFTWKSRFFILRRLPMGQRQAVAIGHFITTLLVREALCRVPVAAATISANVYIDNIRLLGPADTLQQVVSVLFQCATELGAQFNDSAVAPETAGEFLGIFFNYSTLRIQCPSVQTD